MSFLEPLAVIVILAGFMWLHERAALKRADHLAQTLSDVLERHSLSAERRHAERLEAHRALGDHITNALEAVHKYHLSLAREYVAQRGEIARFEREVYGHPERTEEKK